ncbi:MAG: SLC13 family permease [Burkholderiales bacterium]
MPPAPDPHALAVLALTAVAFYLFTRDDIALESTSIIVLAVLTLGFQLWPFDPEGERLEPVTFFHGFGHEALVTICSLMILGRGLVVTGALEPVARSFSRIWILFPKVSLLLLLIFCAAASGVVNDTPLVVLMMPILIGVALRTKTSPSQTLLPMNYAVLMGGMGTTIGTSTNMLVVSIAADLGLRRFGIFDFIHVSALATCAGIAYLWLVLPWLLPRRDSPLQDPSPRVFGAVLYIGEDSVSKGKSLAEVLEKAGRRMKVDRIQRGENIMLAKLPTLQLRAEDRLYVSDTPENLKEFESALGATLHDVDDPEHPVSKEHPLSPHDQQVAQVVVTEDSQLKNRTLRSLSFADVYNVVILALNRSSAYRPVDKKAEIADVPLMTGDVLLVQGAEKDIQKLKESAGLLVLDQTMKIPHTRMAPLALTILALVVGAAALKVAPIAITAFVGVGAMLLTRCLAWKDVGSALSTRVIILVVASLALGSALTETGGTDYLARLFLLLTDGLPAQVVLGTLMLLMAILTNFVSNNAAAAIGTPIAMSIASSLQAAPEPFVLAIMFGANFCYATPMAYQTNLMVMNAAGYRFSDFVRAGVPLTALMLASYAFLLPWFFPL